MFNAQSTFETISNLQTKLYSCVYFSVFLSNVLEMMSFCYNAFGLNLYIKKHKKQNKQKTTVIMCKALLCSRKTYSSSLNRMHMYKLMYPQRVFIIIQYFISNGFKYQIFSFDSKTLYVTKLLTHRCLNVIFSSIHDW